jgi:hypothetical protein
MKKVTTLEKLICLILSTGFFLAFVLLASVGSEPMMQQTTHPEVYRTAIYMLFCGSVIFGYIFGRTV